MSRALPHVAFACLVLLFTAHITSAVFDYCFYCVTNGAAPDQLIQAKLDACCGRNPKLCEPIQPGGPCYVPNNLKATASYVFDSWYVATGDCHLDGVGLVYHADPSHGACKFQCRWENNTAAYNNKKIID